MFGDKVKVMLNETLFLPYIYVHKNILWSVKLNGKEHQHIALLGKEMNNKNFKEIIFLIISQVWYFKDLNKKNQIKWMIKFVSI